MSDSTLRGIRSQSTYPSVGEGQSVFTRHNVRGELVSPNWYEQLVADGRVFLVNNPTVGTALALGGTSYSATAPAFLFDVPVGTTMLPLGVHMVQGGSVAGADITVMLTYDKILRFSSGGTAITPRAMRTDAPVATAVTSSYYGTTATAITALTASQVNMFSYDIQAADVTIGANVYEHREFIWPKVSNVPAPELVGPASFLIFAFAGTTQPSFFFSIAWAEIPTVSA